MFLHATTNHYIARSANSFPVAIFSESGKKLSLEITNSNTAFTALARSISLDSEASLFIASQVTMTDAAANFSTESVLRTERPTVFGFQNLPLKTFLILKFHSFYCDEVLKTRESSMQSNSVVFFPG